MDVIDRINLQLSIAGKTGAELSRDLGLSNSAYSHWNTRKAKPSKKTIKLIADYLGVTVEFLLTGIDSEQNKKPTPIGDDEPSERPSVDGVPLNDKELEWLRRFQQASPEVKNAALTLLRAAEEAANQ